MPNMCKFREPIWLHRSSIMARAAVNNGTPLVGVVLQNDRNRIIRNNMALVMFNFSDYVANNQIFGDGVFWCTDNEYEHNWTILAEEVIRKLHGDYCCITSVGPTKAGDMPKYSIGVNEHLDVIARDTNGRWVYLKKTNDNVDVVVSDDAPNCKVVWSVGKDALSRRLSPFSHWTAVYGGCFVLVRPPINCPDDITIPYGPFLNSRFPFNGDYTYAVLMPFGSRTVIINGEDYRLSNYPTTVTYGQMKLHDDGKGVFYTLTPLYPDRFGARLTRRFRHSSVSVFESSPSVFCSVFQNETNLNTRCNRYLDCITGVLISEGYLPNMYHDMPTESSVYNRYFTNVNGTDVSYYRRTMDVDDDGNKVYSFFESEYYMLSMVNVSPFDGYADIYIYDGQNYVWDARNRSWIREEDAVLVPMMSRQSCDDRYVHRKTVESHECPTCHKNSLFLTTYELTYFNKGERRTLELCDRCIDIVNHGGRLDITTEDGVHLSIDDQNLIRSSDDWTLAQWWIAEAPDEDGCLIDNWARWDEETGTWQLSVENKDDYRFKFTSAGWVIAEKYCSRVNSYFYKPMPIFFKDANENTSKFFGVELEVMDGGESDRNAKAVCTGNEELYAKHDGSLDDGMEIVSHPCSVSWHLNHLWDTVLTKLQSLSYRARSGSGIHIHVSKQYWEDNGGLSKVANLIAFCDLNREALRIYAGRTESMFDHWTHRYLSVNETRSSIRRQLAIDKDAEAATNNLYRYYATQTDHYSIVNLSNSQTVEVRAFASTLNTTRLHSIIQFVDVLTELSTETTLEHEITFNQIKERATVKGYTELLLDSKFKRALEEARTVDATNMVV